MCLFIKKSKHFYYSRCAKLCSICLGGNVGLGVGNLSLGGVMWV